MYFRMFFLLISGYVSLSSCSYGKKNDTTISQIPELFQTWKTKIFGRHNAYDRRVINKIHFFATPLFHYLRLIISFTELRF
jgi:hypothetical protein